MAFESVQIRSTRNGGTPINGYRQDLVIADLMGLSLTDIVGVSSFRWELVGRPEGSSAGGAGPEPIFLSTSSTASFTVDSDAGFRKDGTYVVQCVINGGSPTETRKSADLIRLSGSTLADGRVLRKLGGFESVNEDTSVAATIQGWATMLNRWLEQVRSLMVAAAGLTEVHLTGGELSEAGTDLGTEQVIFEWNASLAVITTATMKVTLSMIARRGGGTPIINPTVRVRIGGTVGAADGTVLVGPVSITALAATALSSNATVAGSSAITLVKITMIGGTDPAAFLGLIRGVHLMFEEV